MSYVVEKKCPMSLKKKGNRNAAELFVVQYKGLVSLHGYQCNCTL